MKRLKIMKSYVVLWLFIYFIIFANFEEVKVMFFSTLTFNIAVLTVLAVGIIMIMKAAVNLVMLAGTFGALAYKKNNLGFYINNIEKIMPASIAHMLHTRAEKGMMVFTAEESHSIVDWISEKFGHQNKYTNYFIGTVLMIGLLGTFSGLIVAIDDMGKIILSLSGDIDLAEVIAGFSGPLGGMATGFGSSLFGVISAIIMGIMGYILNKNQEILIEGIEDWMKGRIIETGGATQTVSMGNGEALPEARGSFMDVFVESLTTLSTEMKKLSEHNEKFHAATVASIEASKKEHSITANLLEQIHSSLENIDNHTSASTQQLTRQFELLEKNLSQQNNNNSQHNELLIEDLFKKLQLAMHQTQENMMQNVSELSTQSANEMKLHTDRALTASTKQSMNTQSILNDIGSTLQNIDKHTFESKEQLQEQFALFQRNIQNDTQTEGRKNEALLIELFKKLETATMENSTHIKANASENAKMLSQFSQLLEEQLKTGIDFDPVSQEIIRMREVLENPNEAQQAEVQRIMTMLQENFAQNEANELKMLEEQRNLIEVSSTIHNALEDMSTANERYAQEQITQQNDMLEEFKGFGKKQSTLVNTQKELIDVTISRGDQLETLLETQNKQLERNGASLHSIIDSSEKNYKASLKISKNVGKGSHASGNSSDNFISKMFK